MQNLFITEYSIGFVCPALLSLVISGTIFLRQFNRRKFTPDRSSLALYFLGASVYNILNFFGFSIYSADAQTVWYIQTFVPFMVLFMIRFAYYYPEKWRESERKSVLISASVISVLAISEYWINSWNSPVLLFGHTSGSEYHSSAIPLIIALFYAWAAAVFIRRGIDYEKKNGTYTGLLKTMINPQCREAGTSRNFACLITLDIIHSFMVYGVMNKISLSSFTISFTTAIFVLIIYSLYTSVYLHSSYENIPVIYRLTGLPLVMSLIMITAGGYIMMQSRSLSYDEMNITIIGELKTDKATDLISGKLPVSYISAGSDNGWEIIYSRDMSFPAIINTEIWEEPPNYIKMKRGGDLDDYSKIEPERRYSVQIDKVNYNQYHRIIEGKIYGFGFPYIDYLKYMHKTGRFILMIMIISMILIITILPVLYYFGVTGPLRKIIRNNLEKNDSLQLEENELHHIEKILKNTPKNKPLPETPEEISPSLRRKLDEIISYLEKNYHDDISREGLASMINLDPDYIGRLFKTYTGMKIGDYINKLRIEEASKFLISGDKSVLDISLISGFESLRTFNRAFIKITGETPTAFRNNNQKKSAG
jgi:AraC-like DNA-binding protein